MHALRNTSELPEQLHGEVKGRSWQLLDDTVKVAVAKTGLLALAGDCLASYPAAMKTIDDQVDQLGCHLQFPLAHRNRTRSTKLLEPTSSRSADAPRSSAGSPGET